MEQMPCTLYRFFDRTGRLLYVGMTINPGRRMERHRSTKEWWSDVVEIRMEQFPDLDTLRAAERTAITTEKPLHNIRMNGNAPAQVTTSKAEQPIDAGLVGKWFHSYRPTRDGEAPPSEWAQTDGRGNVRSWQGQIRGREGDIFICQLYSWWDGHPTTQVLVEIENMLLWRFYDTNEEMLCADGCPENSDRHSSKPCGAPITYVIRDPHLGSIYRCGTHIEYYAGKAERVG